MFSVTVELSPYIEPFCLTVCWLKNIFLISILHHANAEMFYEY